MSSTPSLHRSSGVVSLCAAVLLTFAASVHADPKPLTKEEQAKVDKAIDKGVAYLKRTQTKEGDWRQNSRGGYTLGQTLLAAYALLESEVPVNDPSIQQVTDFIRPRILKTHRTYELSLAVLFLDRLGDSKDEPLIRSLGLRLIAGQHVTGGWNYRCPNLKKEQEEALFTCLTKVTERLEAGKRSRGKQLRDLKVPHSMTTLAVFRFISAPDSLPWQDPPDSKNNRENVLVGGTTDNSNTQFAMLGLWAAQRHDVPVRPTFHLMVERFERTQGGDGYWPYYLFDSEIGSAPHPSMICVGLLGLAIGRGLNLPTSGAPQLQRADPCVLKGLAALSQDIGNAASRMNGSSAYRGLYYLWSVERVGVLYNLSALGDKDWYRWGAGLLIASQQPSGQWRNVSVGIKDISAAGFGPTVNTAFALLFLKRSHPMKELTSKLPIKGKELNQGIARLLGAAPPQEPLTATPSQSEKPRR